MTGTFKKFQPKGYCGSQQLRATVYYHLFPAALNDEELLAEVLRRKDWEIELARCSTLLEAMEISVGRERVIRSRMSELGPDIVLSLLMQKSIDDGNFIPEISLLPPFRAKGFEFVTNRTDTIPPWLEHQTPPLAMLGFAMGRWGSMESIIRDNLFSGALVAYYACPIAGIVNVEGVNLWLSDDFSNRALIHGKYAALDGPTGQKHEVLFDSKQVEKLFPPRARSDSGENEDQESNKTATLPQRIADVFEELYPDGIGSEHGAVKAAKAVVAESLGMSEITDASWYRAKGIVNEQN